MKNATMQQKPETIRLYEYEEAVSIYKRKQKKRIMRIVQKICDKEQKICGFGLTMIGLLSVLILNDGTFACFAAPIGLYAMLTKKDMSGN